MSVWRDRVARIVTWRGALPSRLGLEHISVHVSALLAIGITAIALSVVSSWDPTFAEIETAVVTLPVVWIGSLMVRIAAQMLAIGSHGDEFELVVGPAGNISNDYEQLTGPAMLSYSVAGQAATLLLALLGLLVLGAIAPTPASGLTLASVLDFRSGLESGAWASQIVWVNLFLFTLHLLPAAPFDARALLVGWCRVSQPMLGMSKVHRMLSFTDSHLAFGMAGVALAMIATRIGSHEGVLLWYALLLVSIFLLTVSQYESFQAQMEEEFAEPTLPVARKHRDQATANMQRQSAMLQDFHAMSSYADPLEPMAGNAAADIDEILRKLHREGQDALTDFEKEALMKASRQLQAKRRNSP